MKVRLSKKFVVILGGALVLCGASGAAAVLIGTDKILGPSYGELNGSSCTILKTFKIRKGQSTWIRQYVSSDQAGDGATRVKTALRVARAVQQKEKADLVQIAMIDPAGPKDQAEMRGRMIGAQVVYIPDLTKMPEGAAASHYSAYYVEGAPTPAGEYFGLRVDLPLEDVEHLEARLTDKADCVDPAALAAESEHGSSSAHGKSGHGDAPVHGDNAGHGAAPAGHGEATPAEDHGAAATEAHGAAPSDDHGGADVEAHGDVDDGHAAASAEGRGEVAAEDHADEAAAEAGGGFLSSITAMIFGGTNEPAADEHAAPDERGAVHGDQEGGGEHAAGQPAAAEEAPEPRTSAEGGKRWSKVSAGDEIRSEDHGGGHDAPETATNEAKPAAGGPSEADAAGVAWLAKFRAQQTGTAPTGSDH